jgi:CheY-like chemotaxis protein
VAYTGPEGVTTAREWWPDVVLSDIGLPELDGFGVAEELRQHPATARARLIAVTAYGEDEETVRRAFASGFEYVLAKPADLATLHELLAGAREVGPTATVSR